MSMSLLQTEEEDKDPSSSTVRMVFEPTIRCWFGLLSHVYAMAIAANVLLGLFPFMCPSRWPGIAFGAFRLTAIPPSTR